MEQAEIRLLDALPKPYQLPDVWVEGRDRRSPKDGIAAREVLPWLLLDPNGLTLCSRSDESCLDRRSSCFRVVRENHPGWSEGLETYRSSAGRLAHLGHSNSSILTPRF